MLTIDIPESNAQKSAEDILAQYILCNLKEDGKCQLLSYYSGSNHYPVDAGDWCEGGEEHAGMKVHKANSDIVHDVLRAFKKKGYIVQKQYTIVGFNIITILN